MASFSAIPQILISAGDFQSAVRLTIRFLATSLTKDLLDQLLSFAGWATQGKVLAFPNFNYFKITEDTGKI